MEITLQNPPHDQNVQNQVCKSNKLTNFQNHDQIINCTNVNARSVQKKKKNPPDSDRLLVLSLMPKTMNTTATLLMYILISALLANKATSMAAGGTRFSFSSVDKQKSASAWTNVPPDSDQKIAIGPNEPTPTKPFASVKSTFVGSNCVTGKTSAPVFDTDIITRSIAGYTARRAAGATKNTDCETHRDTDSSMSNNALSVCTSKMNNNKNQKKFKIQNNHNNFDFTKKYQEKTKLMAERELNEAVVVVKATRLALARKVRETIEAVVIHRTTTDQLHDVINPEICCHCYDEGTYTYFGCNLV